MSTATVPSYACNSHASVMFCTKECIQKVNGSLAEADDCAAILKLAEDCCEGRRSVESNSKCSGGRVCCLRYWVGIGLLANKVPCLFVDGFWSADCIRARLRGCSCGVACVLSFPTDSFLYRRRQQKRSLQRPYFAPLQRLGCTEAVRPSAGTARHSPAVRLRCQKVILQRFVVAGMPPELRGTAV